MSTLTFWSACRFFTFCRAVFSENLTVSSSARNHTPDSCGRPLAPIVPSTATCALSRSRCESGIVVMPRTLRRGYLMRLGGAHIVQPLRMWCRDSRGAAPDRDRGGRAEKRDPGRDKHRGPVAGGERGDGPEVPVGGEHGGHQRDPEGRAEPLHRVAHPGRAADIGG